MNKKYLSILLILALVLMFTGCNNKNDTNQTTQNMNSNQKTNGDDSGAYGMGRYIETIFHPTLKDDIAFPIFSILPAGCEEKVKDKITLSIQNYSVHLGDDGNWTYVENSRISKIDKDCRLWYPSIVIGDDGKEYYYTSQPDSESSINTRFDLWEKTEDGLKPVDIPGIDKLINDLRILDDRLMRFHVTKDGDFILCFKDNIQYIQKDGTVKNSWSHVNGYASVVDDGKVYTLRSTLDALEIYDLESGELCSEVSITDMVPRINICQVAALATDANHNLFLQSSKGIFQLNKGATTFTQLINGTLYSMGAEEDIPWELVVNEDGSFSNLRGSAEFDDCTLYQYVYHPDIPTIPEDELTISSYEEIPEVRSAIAKYQTDYPNSYVTYNPVNPIDSQSVSVEDYVQTLNTQLLAGKGPDIIYLDQLDPDTLISKDVLLDLTSDLNQNSDVFDIIKHTFEKDNKIYALASRVEIPVVSGTTDAMNATGSLQELADYAEKSNKKLFGGITKSHMIEYLYHAYKNDIYNEDHSLDINKVQQFLSNMKTIYDQSFVIDEITMSRANSMFNIKDQAADLGLGDLTDVYSIREVLEMIKRADTNLSTLNNNYIPRNIFSVNKLSKKKELAIDFLNTILSTEIQEKDTTVGTSVNNKVVPSKYIDYNPISSCGSSLYYVDMNNLALVMESPFPAKEQIDTYTHLYDEIKTPFIADPALDDEIITSITRYLDGSSDLDDLVTSLKSFLSIYNAE